MTNKEKEVININDLQSSIEIMQGLLEKMQKSIEVDQIEGEKGKFPRMIFALSPIVINRLEQCLKVLSASNLLQKEYTIIESAIEEMYGGSIDAVVGLLQSSIFHTDLAVQKIDAAQQRIEAKLNHREEANKEA